ncbi:FeS assembly protein SufB, partial [mine drainage metagenome]
MRRIRLKAFDIFESKPVPTWGPDLSGIDWENISYYNRPGDNNTNSWDDVPEMIKDTFQKLGIPEMEQKYLAGSVAQYESEGVYHSLKKVWEDKGVVFMDLDSAIREHPDLVKQYFCRAVPLTDNKFAALNGAVWSGGSFLYV